MDNEALELRMMSWYALYDFIELLEMEETITSHTAQKMQYHLGYFKDYGLERLFPQKPATEEGGD